MSHGPFFGIKVVNKSFLMILLSGKVTVTWRLNASSTLYLYLIVLRDVM